MAVALAPALVEAVGISKRFGPTEALADVSLRLPAGGSRALVGRNGAGKSTLVAILTGLIIPDRGTIRFLGTEAPPTVAREAWREHVGCVYQRSTIIPALTVAENVVLNAYPGRRAGFVSWRTLKAEVRALLDEWGIQADIDAPAATLAPAQRQLLEIIRALRLGSRFIILDEPTAQLEASEIGRLFDHMRRLHRAGVGFLYISHHLDEIYQVCDSVTVLRDGREVLTEPVARLGKEEIVDAMVGEARPRLPAATAGTGRSTAIGQAPLLRVEGLSLKGCFAPIDLEVHRGECVGLAGLGASGKAQVADAIAGLLRADRGSIFIDGRRVPDGQVDRAIEHGIGYLPSDRQTRGFCPDLSVEENITMTVLGRLGPLGLIDTKRRGGLAASLIDRMHVLVSSPQQRPSELSGGNQQKTVLGRALASDPAALVLLNPTAGVDVASKRVLLEAIMDAGVAVLLVSDELEELAICDRVIVMVGGRIVREFLPGWSDGELVAAMEGVGHDNR